MKIRWFPALLILIVVAVTVRLGFWQRDRAHQKEALEARITQFENAPAQTIGSQPVALKDIEFHRVRARVPLSRSGRSISTTGRITISRASTSSCRSSSQMAGMCS